MDNFAKFNYRVNSEKLKNFLSFIQYSKWNNPCEKWKKITLGKYSHYERAWCYETTYTLSFPCRDRFLIFFFFSFPVSRDATRLECGFPKVVTYAEMASALLDFYFTLIHLSPYPNFRVRNEDTASCLLQLTLNSLYLPRVFSFDPIQWGKTGWRHGVS